MDLKSVLHPPSLLYPLVAGAVGYLITMRKNSSSGEWTGSGWGALFGVSVGALINSATTAYELEMQVAGANSIQLYDSPLSMAARSVVGQGAAAPVAALTQPGATGTASLKNGG
jgi:hypothetical protein